MHAARGPRVRTPTLRKQSKLSAPHRPLQKAQLVGLFVIIISVLTRV